MGDEGSRPLVTSLEELGSIVVLADMATRLARGRGDLFTSSPENP